MWSLNVEAILSRVPGDWLEKLNGQNVTHRDLNDILSSINSREIVSVSRGRVCAC